MDANDDKNFKGIGNKDLLSYSSIMSIPIKQEINFKFLNLGFNIRDNILCIILFQEGKEKVNDPTNFLLHIPCKSSQFNI